MDMESTKNAQITGKKTGVDENAEIREKEKLLIEQALAGNDKARTEIVLQHQRNIYNLGLRLSGNEEEAECILQDTFLKVFEKLDNFRGQSKLGTWIHRIATNVALMRIRSKKGKYFVPIEEEINDDKEDRDVVHIAQSLDSSPLDLALNEELRQTLDRAIVELPPSLRTAFVLKDLHGLSMADIAEETGKTVSAIKADLHRARVKLRAKLVEFVEGGENG